ncbi:MAG: hypothetical protein V3S05_06165 [Desulfobacterales bacterium]
MITLLLLFAFVVVGLLLFSRWVIRIGEKDKKVTHDEPKAVDILQERYMHGEIDEATFKAIKKDLG